MGDLFNMLKNRGATQKEFSNAFSAVTFRERRLSSATLELTPVCNFKCKMCYVRKSPEELKQAGERILSFDDWRFYIDALAQMNAIGCTFTGGECTLHPQFVEIYRYAYSKGLNITIMTNGSYLTDEILDTWKEMPPEKVYITMYGCKEETYASLCGNAALATVKANIDRLLESRLGVKLQFTATKDNIFDFEGILDYSIEKELGEIRASDYLTPYGNCSEETRADNSADEAEFKRVMKLMWCYRRGLDPNGEEAREAENKTSYPDLDAIDKSKETGVCCNASRSTCHFTWKGMMQPCVMLDQFSVDPHEKGVEQCWQDMVAWGDGVPRLVECMSCIFLYKCKSCIALHYNDIGKFGTPSPGLCWKRLHPEEAAKLEKEYFESKRNEQQK